MNNRNHPHSYSRGLTLVELMVAMALGLLITAAVISIFAQTQRSSLQNENTIATQDTARFTIDTLSQDLLHADFFGELIDVETISGLGGIPSAGADTCGGWLYTLTNINDRVNYDFDVADGTAANGLYSCINAADFRPGTNILTIKRVKGNPVEANTLAIDNKVYVRTNGSIGAAYHYSAAGNIPTTITGTHINDWEYLARVYYIGNGPNDAKGNPIPTLYRENLTTGANPTMVRETLAEGVEYFHIEYGIDDTNPTNLDGYPNFYTDNPGANIIYAVNARISVLVRTPRLDANYQDTRSYTMGGVNVNEKLLGATTDQFNDGYRRRVYTTTVYLQNPSHRNCLGTC